MNYRLVAQSSTGKNHEEFFPSRREVKTFLTQTGMTTLALYTGDDFDVPVYEFTSGKEYVIDCSTEDVDQDLKDRLADAIEDTFSNKSKEKKVVVKKEKTVLVKKEKKVVVKKQPKEKKDNADKLFKKEKEAFKEQYFIQNPKSGPKLSKEESSAWYEAETAFIISHGRVPVYYFSMKYKTELKAFKEQFSLENPEATSKEKSKAEEMFLSQFIDK